MDKKVERRAFTIEDLRTVRSEGDEPPKIAGHAAVFNTWSEDLGGFIEMARPGAFKRSIKSDDIRALWNHDPKYVLGRNKANTLTLAEDERGLYFEAFPPDTQWARDAMVSIDRGDVSQMSFGFRTMKDKWDEETKPVQRELIECNVFDVSPCTFPAYPATDVAVRALERAGISYERLEAVFAKSYAGAELNDEDRAVIVNAISTLNGLSPETEEPAEIPADLSMLRHRLELTMRM